MNGWTLRHFIQNRSECIGPAICFCPHANRGCGIIKKRLHIAGRSKELIIHGGFNVYPPEVEAAINDHPQVIQSAVIGRTKEGDEQVLAFVQIAEGDSIDADALRRFVGERLAGYKRPSQIIFGTSLPAAPTGKILKHKLLETFAGQLD